MASSAIAWLLLAGVWWHVPPATPIEHRIEWSGSIIRQNDFHLGARISSDDPNDWALTVQVTARIISL